MAYDADGTIVVVYDASTDTVTTLPQATLQKINSEGVSYPASTNGYSLPGFGYTNSPSFMSFVFPERRDVVAYFFGIMGFSGYADFSTVNGIQTSTNTTNGVNGTWSLLSTSVAASYSVVPDYRTPTTISALNIKAIRFNKATLSQGALQNLYDTDIYACHLYGNNTNPSDKVEFWKPSTDAILAPADLDFGEIRRETVTTKTFRIKNVSSTLTANSVTITASTNATTSGASTVVGEYQFSLDGGTTYASSRTIASIAPGAISAVVTVKRTTTATSLLSAQTVRINAIATSWT